MRKKKLGLILIVCGATLGWVWIRMVFLPHPTSQLESSLSDRPVKRMDRISWTAASSIKTPSGVEQASQQLVALQKVRVLTDIFKSKNDNDPRLDGELRFLSPADKEAFKKEYQKLTPESLNEKGTIVFLMGRNLDTPQDFDFLAQVLREPRCQSLSDCSKEPERMSDHGAGTTEITLAYPQIVALKAAEAYLDKNPHSPLALQILKEAAASKIPIVGQMARQDLDRSKRNP